MAITIICAVAAYLIAGGLIAIAMDSWKKSDDD